MSPSSDSELLFYVIAQRPDRPHLWRYLRSWLTLRPLFTDRPARALRFTRAWAVKYRRRLLNAGFQAEILPLGAAALPRCIDNLPIPLKGD